MTAITAYSPLQPSAQTWFAQHLAELTSRANAFVRRLPRHQREEAVAEILGQIFAYTVRAAIRGKLHLLTPCTLVSFFGRAYREGRRLAGYSTTDALSPGTRRKHGLRVVSLDRLQYVQRPLGKSRLPLSQVLVSRRTDQPLENCRRDLDYAEILDRQQASAKARRVFRFLAETHGAGQQTELAEELGVSPPRITQLKAELAEHLATEGYGPPNWRETRVKRGRRYDPPLNVGTSPGRRTPVAVARYGQKHARP